MSLGGTCVPFGGGLDLVRFFLPPSSYAPPAHLTGEDRPALPPGWYATAVKNQAVRAASDVLSKGRKECLDLFNVGGIGLDPVALLKSIAQPNGEYGQIRYGVLPEHYVAQTTPLLLAPGEPEPERGYAFITLNNAAGGPWFSESPKARAATILHELAHAYEYIYGPGTSGLIPEVGTDAEMDAASRANVAVVRTRCF